MHIAIEASTWINPRGYGRFTRELTRALLRARTSHRFTLVLDQGAAGASDLPDAPKVVVSTGKSVVESATVHGSRSLTDMAKMAATLSRGFDAVLFPTNYSFVPILPGPFVIVTIMDALPEAMPNLVLQNRRARLLWTVKNRLACWRADLVATISNASNVTIRQYLPIGDKDLVVLTCGASPIFTPAPAPDDERRVSPISNGHPFILYVGGLSAHKRVADLVRTFGEIAAGPQHGDLRLILAGPGALDQFAVDQSGIAEALRSIGTVSDRVIRPGFVSDETLAALYRSAVCAVLPSAMEGFGLPALEAMASGTPLIVTRNPALEELCADAAEYAEGIEDLSATLRDILDNRDRRLVLQRAGPARAGAFGWDEAARRLLAALDRLPANF